MAAVSTLTDLVSQTTDFDLRRLGLTQLGPGASGALLSIYVYTNDISMCWHLQLTVMSVDRLRASMVEHVRISKDFTSVRALSALLEPTVS